MKALKIKVFLSGLVSALVFLPIKRWLFALYALWRQERLPLYSVGWALMIPLSAFGLAALFSPPR